MKRAESIRVMHPLFHSGEGGSIPTSALQLWFSKTDMLTAKRLNEAWHSTLPKFARPTCRAAYVAEYQGLAYATALWTNPLARMLPQQTWIELNRFAIASDRPKNTASRMLAWMTRDIRKRFPEAVRLISYQDLGSHSGTIYRAAGWERGNLSDGGE